LHIIIGNCVSRYGALEPQYEFMIELLSTTFTKALGENWQSELSASAEILLGDSRADDDENNDRIFASPRVPEYEGERLAIRLLLVRHQHRPDSNQALSFGILVATLTRLQY
jgi:hypothetical protein